MSMRSVAFQRSVPFGRRSLALSLSGDDTWHPLGPASSLREDDAKRSVLTYRPLRETILGISFFQHRFLGSPMRNKAFQPIAPFGRGFLAWSLLGDENWDTLRRARYFTKANA